MNLQEYSYTHDFLTQMQQGVANASIQVDIFKKEWDFLVASENKLIALMNNNEQPPGGEGDAEYGLILYWLNETHGLIKDLLNLLGMPSSQITQTMYDAWIAQIETGPGVVMMDGTFISTVKYAGADITWAEAFLVYLRSRYGKYIPRWAGGIKILPFVNNPNQVNLTGSVTIAVMGDWGTGVWPDGNSSLCPAELVSDAIMGLKPDIVIHLGDVYYYGSDGQEKAALNLWPGAAGSSFTLNSNHEMYDGVNGYYTTALDKYPAFSAQNGTSFFAITADNWIIFGLDSAYYDESALYANGALTDADQLGFISRVLAQPGNDAKKIIVMTHHNAVSYDATQLNTYNDGSNSLADDVYRALGNRMPDYWYYGHLHNGIVYDSQALQNSDIFNPIGTGLTSNLRCMGHGGIPFGNAYGLKNSTLVNYFTQTPMPDPNTRQTNRVLNGFMTINLNGDEITETVYEVENANNNSGFCANAMWPVSRV